MSSLDTVRDALLVAHYEKIIDGMEFALLYEANLSRPAYPYYKFDRFEIDSWDDSECRTELRFGRQCKTLICCLCICKFLMRLFALKDLFVREWRDCAFF